MPMGTRHVITGRLLDDHGRLTLDVDDGGRWRLDAGRDAYRLVGRRVTIKGTRVDFDVLDVASVHEAGAPPTPCGFWSRFLKG